MDIPWFGLIGRIVAAYGIYKCIKLFTSFLSLYILPKFGVRVDPKKYGAWAVVTGSTDGIGKSYAKELAKAGINLVLISRSKDRLDATKLEILSIAKVEIKTVAFDFSNVDGYEAIEEALKGLDVGILVNNVGLSYPFPQFTHECDSKLFERLVTINCVSAIKMTKLVLGGMLQRKRGAVVTLSSFSAVFPCQLLNVYSASKVFVEYFTKALHLEYPTSGVEFQVLSPSYVSTKMTGMKPSLMSPASDVYARSALGTLGLSPFTGGYWSHDLMILAVTMLPKFLQSWITTKMLSDVRKRALRRLERKKE